MFLPFPAKVVAGGSGLGRRTLERFPKASADLFD
jgi:hypothetical protein